MSREIPLTRGLVAIVDDEDYAPLAQYRWRILRTHGLSYAIRGGSKGKEAILMHREILGARPGLQVDHANRNGLDNRRINLRLANQTQNNANSRLTYRNKSGYKGVHWSRQKAAWHAELRVDGRKIHLGFFDTLDQAARTYDEAAVTHFGEFARTNASMGLLG